MALLKAPNKQPKTTTLQVRLEDGVRRNLDNYAAFIDASPSYVVSEALKLLFRKDAEFKRWADEHSNHDHAQQLEQGLSSDGRSTYERATPASRKDASTTDTSLKLSSVPGFKGEPFQLQPAAGVKSAESQDIRRQEKTGKNATKCE